MNNPYKFSNADTEYLACNMRLDPRLNGEQIELRNYNYDLVIGVSIGVSIGEDEERRCQAFRYSFDDLSPSLKLVHDGFETHEEFLDWIIATTQDRVRKWIDSVTPVKMTREQYDALTNTPLSKQVGGSHYKDFEIQPVEFIHMNGLGFCAGNVVKYVCRHKAKGGREDLLKARHYLDLLLELEYGDDPEAPAAAGQRPVEEVRGESP